MIEFVTSLLGEDWGARLAYLTNGKHLSWYSSIRFTLSAAFFGGLLALGFGLAGAALRQSHLLPLRLVGTVYINIVRGVPDVLFFLFFPLAFEQLVEILLARAHCTPEEWEAARGLWPPCDAAQWYLTGVDYLTLACVSLGLVYGAFAANVIHGAMHAVARGQLEAARAYGFSARQVFWRIQVRQMWIYALPGLSNVWLLLLKATALLSLLQIPDLVLWAERLGAPNYFSRVGLVHDDWRWRYYLVLFVFYILMTVISERGFSALRSRVGRGMVADA